MDLKNKKITVTGGSGFLGSFVVERLIERGVALQDIFVPRSKDYDLRIKENCEKVLAGQDVVIHLAANVGGIGYNREKPAELFYDNLIMGTYMMHAAYEAGVKKFVAVGTICSYPKFTPVPFREEDIWNGYPEETNAPYGLAKKMLLVQSQAYHQQYGFNSINLLPVNLYGPRDHFNSNTAHVIPIFMGKISRAIQANAPHIDGLSSGKATREFLYVEDAAEAIVLAAEKYDSPQPVNIGSGTEILIRDLASKLCELMGYQGTLMWDEKVPAGQPRRLLDTTRAYKEFGFKAETSLDDGLKKTVDWYKNNNFKK
jgi:GDP-L-fucose synthase